MVWGALASLVIASLFAPLVLVMKHLSEMNNHQHTMFELMSKRIVESRESDVTGCSLTGSHVVCNVEWKYDDRLLDHVLDLTDNNVKSALYYVVYGVVVYYLFVAIIGVIVIAALYRMIPAPRAGQNEQDLAVKRKHRGKGTGGSMHSVLKKNNGDKSVDGEEDKGGNEDGNNSVDGGGGGGGDVAGGEE